MRAEPPFCAAIPVCWWALGGGAEPAIRRGALGREFGRLVTISTTSTVAATAGSAARPAVTVTETVTAAHFTRRPGAAGRLPHLLRARALARSKVRVRLRVMARVPTRSGP